jgi:HEAT repeat protein
MMTRFPLQAATVAVFVMTAPAFLLAEPTKADIPRNLAPELRALLEETFSPDPKRRAEAADRLGEMGEKAAVAVPFLIRLVNDEAELTKGEPDVVSYHAIYSLGRLGPSAVEPLLTVFRRSSDEARRRTLFAMEGLRDRRVSQELLSVIRNPDDDLRKDAAEVLKCWVSSNHAIAKTSGLARSLIEVIHDPNDTIREYLVEALGETRDPVAFDTLVKMLKDPESGVRQNAISALGTLGDARATAILKGEMRRASETARDAGKEGFAAANSLGKLDKSESTSILLLHTAMERPWTFPAEATDIRCGAIMGLGAMKDRQAVEPLSAMLKNKGELTEVRASAARALAQIDGVAAVPLLRQVALDDNEKYIVRFAAAESIAEVTNGAVEDLGIVKVLANEPEGAGNSALTKIAKNGKTNAVRAAARGDR